MILSARAKCSHRPFFFALMSTRKRRQDDLSDLLRESSGGWLKLPQHPELTGIGGIREEVAELQHRKILEGLTNYRSNKKNK